MSHIPVDGSAAHPPHTHPLHGRSVLVAEDEYLIASELVGALAAIGANVVGPFPTPERAMAAIEAAPVDAAILDVKLRDEAVYSVADALQARGTPFVLLTGYANVDLPERFNDVPTCFKPLKAPATIEALTRCFDPAR